MQPTINPEELMKLARGGRIGEALPEIEQTMEEMEARLIRHTLRQLEAGDLDPQAARDAWGQLAAYRATLRALRGLTKEAQAVGSDLKTQLEDD